MGVAATGVSAAASLRGFLSYLRLAGAADAAGSVDASVSSAARSTGAGAGRRRKDGASHPVSVSAAAAGTGCGCGGAITGAGAGTGVSVIHGCSSKRGCGWLFWRKGLIAAMTAHAMFDLVFKVLLPALGSFG